MSLQPQANRLFRFVAKLGKSEEGGTWEQPVIPTIVPEAEANLVGSLTDRGTHMPVIDIDLPIKAVPSRTAGHFHLYIDKEMDWVAYQDLLWALVDAKLVQKGYVEASIKQGATFVRKPGVTE